MRHFTPLVMLLIVVSSPAFVWTQESKSTGGGEHDNAVTQRPVVTLKNGQVLRPKSAELQGEQLTLRFPNGTTRSYTKASIDFDESSGIQVRKDAPKKKVKRSDLSALAGSIKLNKDGDSEKGGGAITIVGDGSAQPETYPESVPGGNGPSLEEKASAPLNKLRRRASDVRTAYGIYSRYKYTVSRYCSGSRYAWRGSQRYILSKHETAECKSAVSRARNAISTLRSKYGELSTYARRNSILPGDLRKVRSDYGLTNFDGTLAEEERYLQRMATGADN